MTRLLFILHNYLCR